MLEQKVFTGWPISNLPTWQDTLKPSSGIQDILYHCSGYEMITWQVEHKERQVGIHGRISCFCFSYTFGENN